MISNSSYKRICTCSAPIEREREERRLALSFTWYVDRRDIPAVDSAVFVCWLFLPWQTVKSTPKTSQLLNFFRCRSMCLTKPECPVMKIASHVSNALMRRRNLHRATGNSSGVSSARLLQHTIANGAIFPNIVNVRSSPINAVVCLATTRSSSSSSLHRCLTQGRVQSSTHEASVDSVPILVAIDFTATPAALVIVISATAYGISTVLVTVDLFIVVILHTAYPRLRRG